MLPKNVRRYLLSGLESTPDVLERLVGTVPEPDTFDRQVDPQRFTLREMLAHVADCEGVFGNRMYQTVRETNPILVGFDEGQWAINHDYAHADPAECLARFRAGRVHTMALLSTLTDEQWNLTGVHTEWGAITVVNQAVLMLGHDGYHLRQAAEWTR